MKLSRFPLEGNIDLERSGESLPNRPFATQMRSSSEY